MLSTGGPGGSGAAAAATPTHVYWRQVGAILGRKPVGDELIDLVKLVQEQTDALRELSPEGVDAELVAAVDEVVRREKDVLGIAATADYDRGNLKKNESLAKSFADANRKAAEAKKRLKSLRDSLNARLHGGFESID